jgi:DNA-binding CsgD family transcriptional regulator
MGDMARLGIGIELVGRRDEVAVLESALESARGTGGAGRPSAILLSGDAGVGKSRMVAEAVDRAGAMGFAVLVGRCLDTADAALPYLPFTEIVGALVAGHPEAAREHPALRSLLPGGVERSEPAGEDRALGQLRVFDAVLSALDDLSERSPALLVVEDLHWADRSSRDLLVFLLSRLAGQRLVVLATYRSDDMHRRHPLRPVLAELARLPAVERLDLAPLSGPDSLELVRRLADGNLPEATTRRIAQRSEGNPFYAEELVSAGTECIPHSLVETLMTRIETLSAAGQQVLRIAAVSGRWVRHDRLAAVSGLGDDELEQALREAVAHQVLVPLADGADAYSFRHALLREAIYHELLPGERTRLHARYAQLLAEDDEPGGAAELAHHAFAGHDLPRALAASVVASREADLRDAPAEMLLHAERALELWSVVPDAEQVAGVPEVTITLWAAWGSSLTGNPDRGAALGKRAWELGEAGAGDPADVSKAARYYAQLLLGLAGREDEASAAAHRALELVADGPPVKLAWAHATLARLYWRIDQPLESAKHAAAAIAAAGAAPTDAMALGAKADALVSLSNTEGRAGHAEHALELLAEAQPLAAESDHIVVELRTHFSIGMSLLVECRLAEASEAFRAGEARARDAGLTWSAYGIDIRVAHVITNFMRGEWELAERAADIAGESLSVSVATRLITAGLHVAAATGNIAAVERRIGELGELQTADDQVLVQAGQAGIDAALWAGEPGLAVERAENVIQRLEAILPNHMGTISLAAQGVGALAELVASGVVAADKGRADAQRLAAVAEQAWELGFPRSDRPGPEATAWRAMARAQLTRLTGPDPAAWTTVVEAFSYETADVAGTPRGIGYRQAYALMRRAEAVLEAGREGPRDGTDVAADLRSAHETAVALGAVPLAGAAAAMAARAGVRLGAEPAPRAAAPDVLTPREQAVLGLVAGGRTNRQVGSELFISEKTVSVHLSRVMAKLGASSRTEAVSIAYGRGLLAPTDQESAPAAP